MVENLFRKINNLNFLSHPYLLQSDIATPFISKLNSDSIRKMNFLGNVSNEDSRQIEHTGSAICISARSL